LAQRPSEHAIAKLRNFVQKYCEKSGTSTHPDPEVTEVVVLGLAQNVDQTGKPLCPCRFYPDKKEEVKHRTWLCACDDMQIYKYCHCLLFVNKEGLPIVGVRSRSAKDSIHIYQNKTLVRDWLFSADQNLLGITDAMTKSGVMTKAGGAAAKPAPKE